MSPFKINLLREEKKTYKSKKISKKIMILREGKNVPFFPNFLDQEEEEAKVE